jgi:hypothetical protein
MVDWRATCSANLPFKARLASVCPCDLYLEWRIWLDNFAITEEIPSCGMMFAVVALRKNVLNMRAKACIFFLA